MLGTLPVFLEPVPDTAADRLWFHHLEHGPMKTFTFTGFRQPDTLGARRAPRAKKGGGGKKVNAIVRSSAWSPLFPFVSIFFLAYSHKTLQGTITRKRLSCSNDGANVITKASGWDWVHCTPPIDL